LTHERSIYVKVAVKVLWKHEKPKIFVELSSRINVLEIKDFGCNLEEAPKLLGGNALL